MDVTSSTTGRDVLEALQNAEEGLALQELVGKADVDVMTEEELQSLVQRAQESATVCGVKRPRPE